MAWTRAALALVAVATVALAVVSGGSGADPRTPPALPGLPPPFLGTAVAGSGGLTAAIDAYGDVVDLRAPGPAGRGLIDNPADRQAAGSVPAQTGIVPRISLDGGPARALWQADSVSQRYLPGTSVVRTEARFGALRAIVTSAAGDGALAMTVGVEAAAGAGALPPGSAASAAVPSVSVDLVEGSGLGCRQSREVRRLELLCGPEAADLEPDDVEPLIRRAAVADRRWLARARPLGAGAPGWARRLYGRSLLTLRALTDRRSGAAAAGARDGWAYVWPRDAGTAALALAASGYALESRRIARFLLGLDLGVAARFRGDGAAVPGRGPQGDAAGWVAVAAQAARVSEDAASSLPPLAWRDRPDYQEGAPGTYLANAMAAAAAARAVDGPQTRLDRGTARRQGLLTSTSIAAEFGAAQGLVRSGGDPASGLDSAAAWAVRPFPLRGLFPSVRRSLLALARDQTRFGIAPSDQWPGVDPWSAPTAWTAWSFAALAARDGHGVRLANGGAARDGATRDRHEALRLLGDLRRAATPAGALPERVDAATGIPRSTTPLAWSHAFAILALHELWP